MRTTTGGSGTGHREHLRALVSDDLLSRVAWSRLVEPGDWRAAALIGEVGAGEALRALLDRDVEWMARYRARVAHLDPERDLSGAQRVGGRVLLPSDDEWPASLDLLRAPPPCLWVRGPARLDEVLVRSAAVVGARAATSYGEHVATELSCGLVERGFAVVSGMAYGIDAAAHRGALAGAGVSVGVVAGGLDRAYPAAHERLLHRLAESGAVVSEVPPGSAPTKGRFLQRNRLIAACTTGTVVVEAAVRSGSLNTARTAERLGKPVGAVPGPVTSPASAGCHALIRSGAAVVVTDAEEVAELLGTMGADAAPLKAGERRITDELDPLATRVLDALPKRAGRSMDRLCDTAGLDPASVQSALGRLALLGLAERDGAGWRIARPAGPRVPDYARQAAGVVRGDL
jgi:DNA processing protein